MVSLQDLPIPRIILLLIGILIYAGLFALLNVFALIGLINIAIAEAGKWVGAVVTAIAVFFGIAAITVHKKKRMECGRCEPGKCPMECAGA